MSIATLRRPAANKPLSFVGTDCLFERNRFRGVVFVFRDGRTTVIGRTRLFTSLVRANRAVNALRQKLARGLHGDVFLSQSASDPQAIYQGRLWRGRDDDRIVARTRRFRSETAARVALRRLRQKLRGEQVLY